MVGNPGDPYIRRAHCGSVDTAPARLETGDSIYFDSGMAHAYIAVGEGTCRVLSVCTSDEPNSEVMYASLIDHPAPVLEVVAPPAPAAAPAPAPVLAKPAARKARKQAAK